MRCYDYVTVPYDRVRGLLHSDAAGIFARATATANDRARELMATLRLNVGPVELGVDVQLRIGDRVVRAAKVTVLDPES